MGGGTGPRRQGRGGWSGTSPTTGTPAEPGPPRPPPRPPPPPTPPGWRAVGAEGPGRHLRVARALRRNGLLNEAVVWSTLEVLCHRYASLRIPAEIFASGLTPSSAARPQGWSHAACLERRAALSAATIRQFMRASPFSHGETAVNNASSADHLQNRSPGRARQCGCGSRRSVCCRTPPAR